MLCHGMSLIMSPYASRQLFGGDDMGWHGSSHNQQLHSGATTGKAQGAVAETDGRPGIEKSREAAVGPIFFWGRSIFECPLECFEKGLLYPTQFLVGLRYLHNHLWVKDEPERWLQALFLCGPGRPIVPVRIGLAHQYCDTTLPPAIPSQIYHRFIQIPIFCDQTFATDTVEEILRWYLWSIMVYPLIYSGFQHVSTIPAWWWISQPPTPGRAAAKCRKPLRSRGWKQEAQNLFWGWGAMTFRSEEHVIP